MKYNSIPPVPRAQALIDVAFRRTKSAMEKRAHSKFAAVRKECKRVSTVVDVLVKRLKSVTKSFPRPPSLFYKELMNITIDVPQFESSLRVINKIIDDILKVQSFTEKRIETSSNLDRLRRAFYGRVSGLLKKADKHLVFLDHVRHIMRDYPMIQDLPTIAIVGFPNVGKTTLLTKLTSSKAKIAPYAFTTQNINCGYITFGSRVIQLLDTPGTLARPEKMNAIEKQAYCAMKISAEKLIYVFDPTDTYPMEQQEKLLEIISAFDKKIILFMSKTDIAQESKIKEIQRLHPEILTLVEEVKDKLI
ncbi:MAG TPA: GTPase [Candidatus Nanoarchaeia archaeon]|nr:GTPase [Candidatus Nanoarchaeia archaeon]